MKILEIRENFRNFKNFGNAIRVLSYDNAMQRLEDKAFRTLSSSASASASSASASAASKRLLERGLSKLKAGRAKNGILTRDSYLVQHQCLFGGAD